MGYDSSDLSGGQANVNEKPMSPPKTNPQKCEKKLYPLSCDSDVAPFPKIKRVVKPVERKTDKGISANSVIKP